MRPGGGHLPFYWLAIGILGVWRLTHLIAKEDGPWNVMTRVRRAAGSGGWATVLTCFYCLSLWVAAPFALVLADGAREVFGLWLALSAGAIALERVTTRSETVEPTLPASYLEHEGAPDDVLRRE